MPDAQDIDQLERQRHDLLGELAAIGPFRPGRLIETRRKCGKPTCHCARPGDPGHPGWALVRRVGGRLVSRGVPRGALVDTRAQIAEHQRFRDVTRRLVEANEDLCRARLKAGRDAGRDAKKGGSAAR